MPKSPEGMEGASSTTKVDRYKNGEVVLTPEEESHVTDLILDVSPEDFFSKFGNIDPYRFDESSLTLAPHQFKSMLYHYGWIEKLWEQEFEIRQGKLVSESEKIPSPYVPNQGCSGYWTSCLNEAVATWLDRNRDKVIELYEKVTEKARALFSARKLSESIELVDQELQTALLFADDDLTIPTIGFNEDTHDVEDVVKDGILFEGSLQSLLRVVNSERGDGKKHSRKSARIKKNGDNWEVLDAWDKVHTLQLPEVHIPTGQEYKSWIDSTISK